MTSSEVISYLDSSLVALDLHLPLLSSSLSRTGLRLLMACMALLGMHLERILMLNLLNRELALHGHILPWTVGPSRSPAAASRVQSDKTTKAMNLVRTFSHSAAVLGKSRQSRDVSLIDASRLFTLLSPRPPPCQQNVQEYAASCITHLLLTFPEVYSDHVSHRSFPVDGRNKISRITPYAQWGGAHNNYDKPRMVVTIREAQNSRNGALLHRFGLPFSPTRNNSDFQWPQDGPMRCDPLWFRRFATITLRTACFLSIFVV